MLNNESVIEKEASKTVKRTRLNIYLAEELKNYVDVQAKNFGLTTSAYMTMLIQNYRLQNDALASLSAVNELSEKLEKLNSI